MSDKDRKIWTTLNSIKFFPTLLFAYTVYIYISAFASLVDTFSGIISSTIGLNIDVIIQRMEKRKSIIKKKKKKHDGITNLNYIEGFISQPFINLCITHHDSLLIDYALSKYDYMKEEITSQKTSWVI